MKDMVTGLAEHNQKPTAFVYTDNAQDTYI